MDHGRTRAFDHALLEGDDVERGAHQFQEFTAVQEEIGIARTVVALVATREGLVDQHAAFLDRRQQGREQGPVEVVGHHDAVEPPLAQGPGAAVLEVDFENLEVRPRLEVGETADVAVDGENLVAEFEEMAGVAPAAAGEVEHPCFAAARFRDQRREAPDPWGWREVPFRGLGGHGSETRFRLSSVVGSCFDGGLRHIY